MKKRSIITLAGFVLMSGWASAGIIFSNSFTGVAGTSPVDTAEVNPGILSKAKHVELDGNGNLIATNNWSVNNYRVQLGTSPLNDTYGQVKLTATFKSPTTKWVGIGFLGVDRDTLDNADGNTGPWLRFTPTAIWFQGGTGTAGGTEKSYLNPYSAGSTNTIEMTYHVSDQTVDLSLNGSPLETGLSVAHEFPVGTSAAPSIQWMQIHFFQQPTDGAYFSDVFVEAIPEPATVGLFAISGAGIFFCRRMLTR